MEVHPPNTQHPKGFTVKTIEGFGENKDYWRIADNLVKNSRLFRSLCTRIYRLSGKAAINSKYRIIYNQRYKDLLKEFGTFERSVNKLIKSLEKKLAKKNEEVKKYKEIADQSYKKYRQVNSNLHNTRVAKNEVKSKVNKLSNTEKFFTKRLRWKETWEDATRAEMMLRTIFVYENERKDNNLLYNEIMYLSIGTQLDAFCRKDIETRFGVKMGRLFQRDVNLLVKVGYIRKFERKQLYYLTTEGKQRFEVIMRKIYTEQFGSYWKDIFNK